MHQSRRFILALAFAAMLPLAASAQQPPEAATCVLTVSKMCCARESKPATAALLQVPGVQSVMPNHKTRTLTIVAHPDASPRMMWESIERLKLGPTRLATAEGVWVGKPTR